MGGTVTPNLTVISLCEATTGWTATGGTNALNDPTVFDQRQGSYCLQNYSASAANRGADYDLGTATDLSNTCLYLWFAFSKVPHATNYMRIRVTDTAGNWGEWNLFNKASLPHLSWIAWCVHTTQPFDATSATAPDKTAVKKVGWRMDAVTAKVYIYWDAWRYGSGLTVTGGTASDPATFEVFYQADTDTANAYGVINKYNGVYYVQGKITIGDGSGTASTYFKDTSKVVMFQTARVGNTFYEIIFAGNTTGTTEIYFGEKVGGKGVSGLYIASVSSSNRFALTATNVNLMSWKMCGTTFYQARRIQFPAYSTDREVLNCNFEACYEVYADTTKIQYCNFIAPSGETTNIAVKMSSTGHHITNCTFINCANAIETSVAGPFTFTDLDFSGNTYDVYNTSGAAVTVNYDQACSPAPSTYNPAGSTVTFQASVTLTVRHVKTGNEPTEYVRCSIHKKSDMSEIMNKDATEQDELNPGYYKASMTYTQTGIEVIVRAREKGWLPFEIDATITSNGLDVTAVWLPDPNYSA